MIKKYKATKDNTITNAYTLATPAPGTIRATGSNMGMSDILEVFSIYGACVSCDDGAAKKELSRFLLQFDVDALKADRTNNIVPANAKYYLKLYNATSTNTVPKDFTLDVCSIGETWEEGIGLDMDLPYEDKTYDVVGSNWVRIAGSTSWATAGAIQTQKLTFTASFDTGLEDLSVEITPLVSDWVAGSLPNYGVAIQLSPTLENLNKSYYSKRFFGRGTNRFFDKPVIEAQWDSAVTDDRGGFYLSSSLVPPADNINTIYLYNYARGRLTNIPSIGVNNIMVSLFSGSAGNNTISGSSPALVLSPTQDKYGNTTVRREHKTVVTGSYVSKGIYSASFAYTGSSTIENIYDVWFKGHDKYKDAATKLAGDSPAIDQFSTGSIKIKRFSAQQYSLTPRYILTVSNKNSFYQYEQTHRIRLYSREKNSK